MRPSRRPTTGWLTASPRVGALWPLAALVLASGCVTTYQPLTSLQRPVVLNPERHNFEDVELNLRCIPSDDDAISGGESETLCTSLKQLFVNQGAKVTAVVEGDEPLAENEDLEDRPSRQRSRAKATAEPPRHGLMIDLTARRLHYDNWPIYWVLSVASATLLPAITEATFAQDIVIRDAKGVLLGSDSLQARFVRYFGLGAWALHSVLNLFRSSDEQISNAAAKRDFSKDFYGQLSQLVFNAHMKERALNDFAPLPGQAPASNPANVPAAPAGPVGGPAARPTPPSPPSNTILPGLGVPAPAPMPPPPPPSTPNTPGAPP